MESSGKTVYRYCVLPHKFQCQKENKPVPVRQAALKRQRLSLVQDTLSQAATREVITETKLCGGPADTTITREINYCEAGPSSSSHDVFSTKNESLSCDKAVQVNTIKQSAIKYRSKGVNVGSKTKNVAVSPFLVPVKNTSTSPIKTAPIAGTKRELFPDIKPTDDLSLTSQSSSISSEYEQESTSSEASWAQDNEDRQFKNRVLLPVIICSPIKLKKVNKLHKNPKAGGIFSIAEVGSMENIRIVKPANSGSFYVNYKEKLSIVLIANVNAN
ncbi:hypothetical protein JTB14_025182 [Gonioctena quinquepunctata]|nr:hypothetical protein JTB14_025182 [Gonioctena quinquepunctata]